MNRRGSKGDVQKVPFEAALDQAGFGLYSYSLTCLAGVTIISFACISFGTTIIVPASACELETTVGQQGALVAAPIVGSILGGAIWGYLADTRGRRSMLLVSLLSAATVNVFVSLSVNWLMMIALQFIVSFLASGLYSMSMTILSESVPMMKRNFLVLLVNSIFQLSQGIMAVLAIPIIPQNFSYYLPALGIYWNSWRTLVVVYSIPSLLTALWVYFVHESPKFVFARGDEKRALEILKRMHKLNNLRSDENFQVQGLIAEQVDSKPQGSNSLKDQVLPLFRKPLLKNTLIVTALLLFQQVGAFSVWLPTITNQFIGIIETGQGTNLTLCGIIRTYLDEPPETPEDAVPCALNETALLLILIIGVIQASVNTLLSLIVNYTGRRNMVMAVTSLCGISGILVNLVPNAYASAALFVILCMGIIVIGLYTAIIVALFPTHLRALAIALPMVAGRIANFATIQIVNLLLANNCEVAFYLFCTIFASSAIVVSFIPDDRRVNKVKQINQDEDGREDIVEKL